MQSKVAVAVCADYRAADLQKAFADVIAGLGGLNDLVRSGQRVLLKPNLISDKPPERAITTHPEVVRVLIRWLKTRGALPMVADSACSAIKIESVWEKTGFRALCDEESVPLINLEQAGSVQMRAEGAVFSIARPILDADLLINVPKLKTHVLTALTNAVKNMYGTLPGFQKTILHKQYPTPRRFSRFLAALYARVRPAFTLCDAVVAMHGNGPTGGEPIALGFLAGATDGVALDAALCRLLQISLRKVPYLEILRKAGVGLTDANDIELVGQIPELPASFRVPHSALFNLIPAWLARCLSPLLWIRPAFTARCARCGLCVKACPVRALRLDAGGGAPILNPALCIGCCCCHEVCPEKAVVMTQSPLLNLRKHGRLPS